MCLLEERAHQKHAEADPQSLADSAVSSTRFCSRWGSIPCDAATFLVVRRRTLKEGWQRMVAVGQGLLPDQQTEFRMEKQSGSKRQC